MRKSFFICALLFSYCAESFAQPVVNSGAQIITKATQAAGVVSGTTTITGGATTQVCFNDAGVISCGNAGFTFNKATGTLTITILELGNATDTTIARVSAGKASIEGDPIATLGAIQTFTAAQTFGNTQFYTVANGSVWCLGNMSTCQMYSTVLTPDSVMLLTDEGIGNTVHINEYADRGFDFQGGDCGTSVCTDPHLIGHSHLQDTTSYWSLYNDGVNSYHKTGVGGLGLPGMIFTVGTVPAVSNTSANSCGTTTATITGTDTTGVITVGATSGTSCTLTFNVAALNRRQCWANDETTAVLTRYIYLTTTTAKIDGVFTAGDKISYGCIAY